MKNRQQGQEAAEDSAEAKAKEEAWQREEAADERWRDWRERYEILRQETDDGRLLDP